MDVKNLINLIRREGIVIFLFYSYNFYIRKDAKIVSTK